MSKPLVTAETAPAVPEVGSMMIAAGVRSAALGDAVLMMVDPMMLTSVSGGLVSMMAGTAMPTAVLMAGSMSILSLVSKLMAESMSILSLVSKLMAESMLILSLVSKLMAESMSNGDAESTVSMDFVSQGHGVPHDGPEDSNAGG
jgi:hypothetical protein